jgi:hypothetical protein
MRQFTKGLVLIAGTFALAACASNGPAKSTAQASTTVAPKGYRLVTKKGTEYFCRDEAVTGSHTLKSEVCVTPDQLEADRAGKISAGGMPAPTPAQVGSR